MEERVAQLRISWAQVTLLEQHPDLHRVVDRVRERVGASHLDSRSEQQLEALGVVGLDRVIDRLAVVGVRPTRSNSRVVSGSWATPAAP